MKKIIILIVGILLLVSPLIAAQEVEINAGITPDQGILWELDMFMERIQIMFTFRQEEKVALRLQIAEERLAEIQVMADQNKIQFMNRAESERNKIIDEVERNAVGLSEEYKLQISERLQNHIYNLEQVRERVSEQARDGLENAINRSSKVLERMRIRTE